MASRRQEDPELTQAEIEHIRAQTGAIPEQSRQEALRTAVAQQEQQTRAAAQAQAAREGEAKIAQEQVMTPFQKLLALSQAGAPALQDRASRLKAAVDLYQIQQTGQVEANRIQAQKDVEAQRARANTTDTLIQHAVALQIDPAVFREALKLRGVPELADAYDVRRAKDVADKVDFIKSTTIPTFQKAGHLDKVLPGITDPEVVKQIKPYIDDLMGQRQKQAPTATAPVVTSEFTTGPTPEQLAYAKQRQEEAAQNEALRQQQAAFRQGYIPPPLQFRQKEPF
jgi:hypothetical protein